MIARLVAWMLKRVSLSAKDRLVLTNAVIHSMHAVPLHAIITVDENRRVLVGGKAFSAEQMLALRESADTALNSQARALIREQVRFAAINNGFLQSEDPRTQLFYKAALWFAQEEQNLLQQMSGTPDPTA